MYQTRQATSTRIPIPRKGTKYVARARSHHKSSVPVVIALRDMLGLARNAKEAKKMVNQKQIKINGIPVKDIRESIKILNVFEADKVYLLTLNPHGRFVLVESKEKDSRIAKVVDKKLLQGKKVQLNLHDGSNIISSEKVSVGDSVMLSFDKKVKKSVKMEKGATVLIISGKYAGLEGKILDVKEKVSLKVNEKEVSLAKKQLIVR